MYINTVRGRIEPQQLGMTYAHEHLKLDLSGQKGDPDTRYDDVDSVIAELKSLSSQGLGSVMEMTNWGMGRDVCVLMDVAEATGLNVVAATGVYKEPFLPDWVYTSGEGEIAAKIIGEIVQGIGDTGVRAHVIGEVGTSAQGITDAEAKVLRAAARASLETGHPIYTHTTLGKLGLEQVKLFQKLGADLSRVVIGHTDLSQDPELHLRLADTGCYLGFDTVGKLNYQSDQVRAQRIKELVERGHHKQILLSLDLTRKSHLQERGGIGYAYLLNSFVPLLLSQGLQQRHIDAMLIENPARLLAVE